MAQTTRFSYEKSQKKSFNDLAEEAHDKLKSVLFAVLNKFCIGDAAYYEGTICTDHEGEDLPRSYSNNVKIT